MHYTCLNIQLRRKKINFPPNACVRFSTFVLQCSPNLDFNSNYLLFGHRFLRPTIDTTRPTVRCDPLLWKTAIARWRWIWLQSRSFACPMCEAPHRLQLKLHLSLFSSNVNSLNLNKPQTEQKVYSWRCSKILRSHKWYYKRDLPYIALTTRSSQMYSFWWRTHRSAIIISSLWGRW